MSRNSGDERARAIAASQFGLITRGQAVGCGLTPKQAEIRVRSGRWIRVHPGVYMLVGTPASFEQRLLGACLAAGPGAVTSHRTAAHLWGLLPEDGRGVAVTVPEGRHPRLRHATVHRTRLLRAHERTMLKGIPVTTPMRTIVDTAGDADPDELEELVDGALRRELVSLDRLLRYLAEPAVASRPGAGRLRTVLADRRDGVPESVLEAAMLRLLRTYRLPDPVRQHRMRVRGRPIRLDLAYPDHRVGIELDGYAFHGGPRRRRADSRRQNAVEVAGWRVLRFTWQDVDEEPDEVVRTVAGALGLRPARWVPDRTTSGDPGR